MEKKEKIKTIPKDDLDLHGAIDKSDVIIDVKEAIRYSPDGINVVELPAGKYKGSDLHPVVLALHKQGIV